MPVFTYFWEITLTHIRQLIQLVRRFDVALESGHFAEIEVYNEVDRDGKPVRLIFRVVVWRGPKEIRRFWVRDEEELYRDIERVAREDEGNGTMGQLH